MENEGKGKENEHLEVIKWWAQHADRVIVFFDPNKLDISDEFRSATNAAHDRPYRAPSLPILICIAMFISDHGRCALALRCVCCSAVMEELKVHQQKVRVVLNKADEIEPQKLMRVCV